MKIREKLVSARGIVEDLNMGQRDGKPINTHQLLSRASG
jgi:hypothetical protein